MHTLFMLLDWLNDIESGEVYTARAENTSPSIVPAIVARLQGGNFFACDGQDCNVKLFYSYGAQDRLGYEHFNNGVFLCATCERKELEYMERNYGPLLEEFDDDYDDSVEF